MQTEDRLLSELQGTTALVTGASRGIGAATAVALAKNGVARVVVHYGSFREGAERTASLIQGAGAEAELITGDLSHTPGIHEFVNEVKKTFPEVDILVNNAGSLVKRAKLLEFTDELYDEVMNLNVKSVWFLSQAVAPHMSSKGKGAIINVSSIAARNGGGLGATIYSAAKAAVSTMTKGLAKELAPAGVRVNAVSPGTVDNHFHEVFSNKQMLDNMVAQTPAGRLGTNEEVADTILFLCSEASRYIYGQTIEINGGMYMV
ncbi:MAG: 3-oxoacyl-ACP reductase FabG [Acidobacteriota bacterium]|nr:3-oxoacyl-ACP reductase FabG [Acidobacteriota bacterium]